jgi:myo-inositol-1(or 4)-monophosphatase
MTAAARLDFAIDLARRAGDLALARFRAPEALKVEQKGPQDLVSDADRAVEAFVRAEIASAFPDDGIVGEEEPPTAGTGGFVWIIDPIDGTGNYVRGIACWCVAIAIAHGGRAVAAVTRDAVAGETFYARAGGGAFVNGRPMRVAAARAFDEGTVGIGISNRREPRHMIPVAAAILDTGGLFGRNGSGALSLAHVAAGRLLGYCEEHMNAWDCLGGLLMVAQAGGRVHDPDPSTAIADGTVVIAACPALYDDLEAMCRSAFTG